jgi:hypothetical protein
MAVTYKKAVDDNVDWQQRLANYAGNKDAGLSEYQRALEVYRGKSAAGDTAGADAAKKWSDQVNTAIGGIGNNRGAQASNALDTVGQKVNAQPFQFKQNAAPFQYNAQADPSYQAALRQAQAGAQTATNNAMVRLGARGIGNSSVAVDRANQIQQKAIGNVNDTILPQLMQQAYGRYQDEVNNDYRNQLANYQASQDQIGNLSKYAGTLSDLDQRDLDNQFRGSQAEEQQKQSNWNAYLQSVGLTGDLGTGPKSDYSLLGGNSGNRSLAGQEFDQSRAVQDAGLTGIYNGNPTMQKNAQDFSQWADRQQLGISRQNANNSGTSTSNAASNARINQLMDAWDRTGVAPAGLESMGVQAGTPLREKSTSTASKVDAKESANNYSIIVGDLSSDGVTKDQAMALAQANSSSLSDSDYRKLLDYINKSF